MHEIVFCETMHGFGKCISAFHPGFTNQKFYVLQPESKRNHEILPNNNIRNALYYVYHYYIWT